MNKSIIDSIYNHALEHGVNCALLNPYAETSRMSYRELYCKAFSLALHIAKVCTNNEPIIVYGHKSPYMIVSFLACVLAGHAYCPVDKSMPHERIEMILSQTKSEVLLATEDIKIENTIVINYDEIIQLCGKKYETIPSLPDTMLSKDDTFYIIFTSGSTGTPKGVEITFQDLDNFLKWSCVLGEEHPYSTDTVFLNQAPFSFDLSVMDLYTSLYCGATLCMMDKEIQTNLGDIVPFIKDNAITAFVSTPSFVNMCLVDRNFNSEKISTLDSFFFCGETLANKTARKLMKRFPNAVIQNTYGPTESTVAVSSVRITKHMLDNYDPLPVGVAKSGTGFLIEFDGGISKTGEKTGEILIIGDTLAKGYYKQEDLTNKAFIYHEIDGVKTRAYRTGDNGYLAGEMLFYNGRIDLQIKLNGYRIELGDIESSILKIPNIDACVVIPRTNEGKVKSLVAVIVTNGEGRKLDIKTELEKVLPMYMIPQNYVYVEALPMTNNGKVDRKKLARIIEEE